MGISKLPSDPMMLMSFLNTKMRDEGVTLDDICAEMEADKESILGKLDQVGFEYNPETRRFE